MFGTAIRLSIVLSALALLAGSAGAQPAEFSWQRPHARVLPQGDLEWQPEPFEFRPGQTVRYIDFENGDDANPGTRDQPWKHHPWDANAASNAAEAQGVDTYVFRRGVIYRGQLTAQESGQPDRPILLTSDPDWGEGEAMLYGSVPLTDGWQQVTPETAPASLPEPQRVWVYELGTEWFPRALYEVHDGQITRIHLARDPNWTVSNPDDVKAEWYEWKTSENVETDGGMRTWAMDPEHLTAEEEDAYVGGTVWTEYSGVMASPYPTRIEDYDPQRGAVLVGGPWGNTGRYRPIIHNRYYLENLPRFLDSDGEYWYDDQTGRLYVRLPEGRNPNESHVEVPRLTQVVQVRDQNHIRISGLTFRFNNGAHWYDRWWDMPEEDGNTVSILGNCDDVAVSHCLFEHVRNAIWANAPEGGRMDRISVTDNDVRETDYDAIVLRHGGVDEQPVSNLYRVEVLRNRLYRVGLRPLRSEHGMAVTVSFPAVAHVAGNVLDRIWGAGLFVFGGKGSGQAGERALSRILIHHNKVTDPLLNTNDWGGIETWQGGPHYVFNNVSGNPGGYWHTNHVRKPDPAQRTHTTARFGFAYYLDGSFKNYLFNNIAWGKNNDLTSPLANTTPLQEIIGFQNNIFNNSFYKFVAGSRRQAPQAGRNKYLGNIWQDMSEMYFRHANERFSEAEANAADAAVAGSQEDPYDYATLAYAANVFFGDPRAFGVFEHLGVLYESLQSFRQALAGQDALADQVGWNADAQPMPNAAQHDFRLGPDSPAIDRGVKFFVPWGLYGMVGEWNFYRTDDPSTVVDEHWYLTALYRGRGDYRHAPRYDLSAQNVTAESYTDGVLEDWTAGALTLNGQDQFLVLADETLKTDVSMGQGERATHVPGPDRKTVDMGTNNFLIEVHFKTDADSGTIVSKSDGQTGYVLDLDAGRPRLTVLAGGERAARTASTAINDGQWHHVIAEVDRAGEQGITLYVDGQVANGDATGQLPPAEASLSNTADFLVGRGADEGSFFAGTLEFLRVARGTLTDAATTIEELYAWQFDGPFLRDFTGAEPTGERRDAGALEAAATEARTR